MGVKGALTSPGYIVDVIAFVLLGFGGVWLLRHSHSTGPISAAWGYCAALGWRSYFLRVHARVNDLPIYDNENMQIERLVGLAMVVAFVMLGWCMVISVLHTRAFRMSQQ